eukprot:140670-Amorphochlora_amoeboformis.AAC.2
MGTASCSSQRCDSTNISSKSRFSRPNLEDDGCGFGFVICSDSRHVAYRGDEVPISRNCRGISSCDGKAKETKLFGQISRGEGLKGRTIFSAGASFSGRARMLMLE